MILSLSAQSALNTTGTMGDFGVPAPGALSGAAPQPGVTPMPRAYPFGVVLSSAGVSAGAVQLQGSLDGTNWYNIGAPVTINAASSVFALPTASPAMPARYLRATITTAITGGTVNAWVDAAP